jgi:hypothetical protein
MKAIIPMILVIPVVGCATLAAVPPVSGSGAYTFDAAAPDPAPATIPPLFQDQNIGPRLIIPVTGGFPVMGIPLGGNIYQPVTGGLPVVGTPITP